MIWAGVVLWVHLLAAIFWVGGQLFLVTVVVPVLRQQLPDEQRLRVAAAAGRRFAVLSGGALAVLLITGPINAAVHGISGRILRDTEWGHVLIAKVCLVLIVLVLTGVHGAYYGRRMEALAAAGDADALARRRLLQRRSVRISALNLLLNILIVGLAAWLASLP